MASYALLDQAEEDKLHSSRLLNVEEKPFKRITKRLLSPNSLISIAPQLPPTPPPDAPNTDEAAAAGEAENQKQLDDRRQFREEVLLDFAAFESSIIRIQFLLASNQQERDRYAAEKVKIQATAQQVRDNTVELRVQLEEAQNTLALKKTWDDLSEKITSNRLLRPREDQQSNLEKLKSEIVDLERESRDYAATWAERRQQFGRIIEEGMLLRRLIRDEKEEVERREGMEEREDGEDGEGTSQRGRVSGAATPRHDTGGATPLHPGIDGIDSISLTVNGHLHARTRSPLRSSAPAPGTEDNRGAESEDVNMAEDGEVSGNDEPRGDGQDGDERERGVGDDMEVS